MNKKNIILFALLLGYLTCNTGIYLFLTALKIKQENWVSIDIELSQHFLVIITIIAVYSWGRVIFNKPDLIYLDSDILLKILYIAGLMASPFIYLSLDMLLAKVIEPLTAIVAFAFATIIFIFFSKYIRNKYD